MEEKGWDERELVRRCKEGSEAAYAELIRQHRQRLLNLAYRLTDSREVAEDIVQDTFLAAFRAMERFEPRPSVAPWLNTICIRLAGRVAKKRSAAPSTSLDRLLAADAGATAGSAGTGGSAGGSTGGSTGGATASGPTGLSAPLSVLAAEATADIDPHVAAETAELRAEIGRAISRLPYKQRVAVTLRYVAGMDYADAARAMDVPLNTYKSHVLRGTRFLREALGPPTEPTPRPDSPGGAIAPEAPVPSPVVPATDTHPSAEGGLSADDHALADPALSATAPALADDHALADPALSATVPDTAG